MKVVHDDPRAEWLPSRHHFALARLVAYLRLRTVRATTPDVDHLILGVDRHQSAIENHAVSFWFLATTACFIAAALPLPLPLALIAAVPLATIAVQIPVYIVGLPFSDARINARFLMLCTVIVALYFASSASWARFPAYILLAAVVLNGAAAIVMWLLRHRVRELEQRCCGV